MAKTTGWQRQMYIIVAISAMLGVLCCFHPIMIAAIALAEYLFECRKYHTFLPPMLRWIRHKKPTAAPKPIEHKKLTLSAWYLSDFIQCCFFGDFTSTGGEMQFARLLYEYYDAKKDDNKSEKYKLRYKVLATEYRRAMFSIYVDLLSSMYTEEAATGIRALYDGTPCSKFTISKDTYQNDITRITAYENTRGKLEYDRAVKELASMEKESGPALSKREQYEQFLTTVSYIEKYQGYGLPKNTTDMAYFAVLENLYQKECERLAREIANAQNIS